MKEILVLCYHAVSATWHAPTAVRLEDFEQQLVDLVGRGYYGMTFSAALTAPVLERVLAITFDDAHRSVLELTAPVMAPGGAGNGVRPDRLCGDRAPHGWDGYDVWLGTEHEAELRCLGWEELRDLVDQGWEVGSHTRSHPRLPELGDAEIAAELTESRRECEERLGAPCGAIAYPYGAYDDRVVRLALESGYSFGASAPRHAALPLPLAWPRVGVYRGERACRLRLRASSRRLQTATTMRVALGLRRLSR